MTSNNNKIYFVLHQGIFCSYIIRSLQRHGKANFVICTNAKLQLTNQAAVHVFFKKEKRTHAYITAAKAGWNHANKTYPAELITQDLMVQANVVNAASTTTKSAKL